MKNTNKKATALSKYLGEKVSFNGETYNTETGAEYEILTNSEANKKAKDYILSSLWAFNADFIISHCLNYEKMDCYEVDAAIEALQEAQKNSCENLNGLVRALIKNINNFVYDAIREDGRGNFISFYDGGEIELDGFFAYRIN